MKEEWKKEKRKGEQRKKRRGKVEGNEKKGKILFLIPVSCFSL